MTCQVFDKELNFTLQVPADYAPSKRMPVHNTSEWLSKISLAALIGEIREELADKILDSIQRLPKLAPDQTVSMSYSGGKDSEVAFIIAAMKYPLDRMIALFADTDDEWPETYDHITIFEKWIGVKVTQLKSLGIHRLLRGEIGHGVNKPMPYWPKKKQRHCTKFLKMIPQRDYFDDHGYAQVRYDKQPDTYRDTHHGGAVFTTKHPAPLTLAGERKAESSNRSLLDYDERQQELLRWTHRPVLDWTIEDVWDFLFWMKAPLNPIYQKGINRCACAGCIFANPKEIELLGEHHPDMLERWVETENSIGHPWKGKHSMQSIYNDLAAANRLGIKSS